MESRSELDFSSYPKVFCRSPEASAFSQGPTSYRDLWLASERHLQKRTVNDMYSNFTVKDRGDNEESCSEDEDTDNYYCEEEDTTQHDSETEDMPLDLSKKKSAFSTFCSFTHFASTASHDRQICNSPTTPELSSQAVACHISAPSLTNKGTPSDKKDAEEKGPLYRPLIYGWQRKTLIKKNNGIVYGLVLYYSPCNKLFHNCSEIKRYLTRKGITHLTGDHFNFSIKTKIGEFFEARDGPEVTEGVQFRVMNENEIMAYMQLLKNESDLDPSGNILKGTRVRKDQDLPKPFQYGWRRETFIRNFNGYIKATVVYSTPCGRRLKTMYEINKYLEKAEMNEITHMHFTFNTVKNIGDFFEGKDEPEGLRWHLLKPGEVVAYIQEMKDQRIRLRKQALQSRA